MTLIARPSFEVNTSLPSFVVEAVTPVSALFALMPLTRAPLASLLRTLMAPIMTPLTAKSEPVVPAIIAEVPVVWTSAVAWMPVAED